MCIRTRYSHGVCRFVAEHAAMMPFDDVVGELRTCAGVEVGKRQVEEIAVRAANDFEPFYAQRRTAAEVCEETDDLLVLTFDGKGIVMVPDALRAATKKAAAKKVRNKLATRLSSGEKRNRKRMAEVAAIYTVAPFERTPTDVLADLRGDKDEEARRERRGRRPKVRNKRVWASGSGSPGERWWSGREASVIPRWTASNASLHSVSSTRPSPWAGRKKRSRRCGRLRGSECCSMSCGSISCLV